MKLEIAQIATNLTLIGHRAGARISLTCPKFCSRQSAHRESERRRNGAARWLAHCSKGRRRVSRASFVSLRPPAAAWPPHAHDRHARGQLVCDGGTHTFHKPEEQLKRLLILSNQTNHLNSSVPDRLCRSYHCLCWPPLMAQILPCNTNPPNRPLSDVLPKPVAANATTEPIQVLNCLFIYRNTR